LEHFLLPRLRVVQDRMERRDQRLMEAFEELEEIVAFFAAK
jgi:hypothetical protein